MGLYDDVPPPSSGEGQADSSSAAPKKPQVVQLPRNMIVPTAASRPKPGGAHNRPPHEQQPVRHTPAKPDVAAPTGGAVLESAPPPQISGPMFDEDFDMVDEYDPCKPNSYEAYCREREEAIRQEEMRRVREEMRLKAAEEAERAQPKVDLRVSGEEAYLRRLKLSSKGPSMEEPVQERDDRDVERERDPSGVDDGEEMVAGTPANKAPDEQQGKGGGTAWASNLLKRMGWKEGKGLGKASQGIAAPLVAQKTDRRSGVIVKAANDTSTPPPAPARPKLNLQNQSPVILLMNMVGPGEVDDDLQGETADECSKYGVVEKCTVVEITDRPIDPARAVRIFVKFQRRESAMKAVIDLNGRFFGGRVVEAEFYSEDDYDTGQLLKNL